jgi:hypothetical protein
VLNRRHDCPCRTPEAFPMAAPQPASSGFSNRGIELRPVPREAKALLVIRRGARIRRKRALVPKPVTFEGVSQVLQPVFRLSSRLGQRISTKSFPWSCYLDRRGNLDHRRPETEMGDLTR